MQGSGHGGAPVMIAMLIVFTIYWLSTLPEDIEFAVLVDIAKLRWRIERD
jgi:hypothetical protein